MGGGAVLCSVGTSRGCIRLSERFLLISWFSRKSDDLYECYGGKDGVTDELTYMSKSTLLVLSATFMKERPFAYRVDAFVSLVNWYRGISLIMNTQYSGISLIRNTHRRTLQ